MSRPIDERVVKLSLDNEDFEKNAKQSMQTFGQMTDEFESSDAGGLSAITNEVKRINSRFTLTGRIVSKVLDNIATKAVNVGNKVVRALSIEGIMDGYNEYELKLNSISTIMANTQREFENSKGEVNKAAQLKKVSATLNELNKYADKTVYSFSDMTRNIGLFTAAGVTLKQSTNSIKGLSNLAAQLGVENSAASRATYQLSQAIASGTTNLMDWRSVENAGMGGRVFQKALWDTAKSMGRVNIEFDDLKKKGLSFRNTFSDKSLKGWLSSKVLTTTLKKFATSEEDVAKAVEKYKDAKQKFNEAEKKYNKHQTKANKKEMDDAEALMKKRNKNRKLLQQYYKEYGKTANEAATKVKSFRQLMDTTKEAIGSGWAETWETVIGNIDEAKELWTAVSKAITDPIQAMSDARNKLLKDWKKEGGRDDLFKGISNLWNNLTSIFKAISDGFGEIFPPVTVKNLTDITDKFLKFTESIKISDKGLKTIKNIAKLVATVLKTMGDAVIFLVTNVPKMIPKQVIDFFKELFYTIGDSAKVITDFINGVKDTKKQLTETSVFQKFKDMLKSLGDGFGKFLAGSGLTHSITAVGIVLLITQVYRAIKNIADKITGVIDKILGITKIKDDTATKVKTFFADLKESTSKISDGIVDIGKGTKIASFGILALGVAKLLSVIVQLSKVDPKAVSTAMVEATAFIAAFGEIAMRLSNEIDPIKMATLATSIQILSDSIVVMSVAFKILGTLSLDQIGVGLAAIGGAFVEIIAFSKALEGVKMASTAGSMVMLSTSLVSMSAAFKVLGSLKLEEVGTGLTAIGGAFGEIAVFSKSLSETKMAATAGSMIPLATSLVVMATAFKILGSMKLEEAGTGLTAIGGALGEIAIFSKSLSDTKMAATAGSMLMLSTSLVVMSGAFKVLGTMKLEEVGTGLTAIGGVFTEIAIFAKKLDETKMAATSGSLILISTALVIMSGAFKVLGSMKLEEVGTALTAIGGALGAVTLAMNAMWSNAGAAGTIVIIAGALLVLSQVFVILGRLKLEEVGTGLTAIGGAMAIFVAAGMNAMAIVPGLNALSTSLISFALAMGALAFLLTSATAFLDFLGKVNVSIGKFIAGIVKGIAELIAATPVLMRALTTFILTFLSSLGKELPRLVQGGIDFAIQFINSFADGIKNNIEPITDAIINLASALGQALYTVFGTLIPMFMQWVSEKGIPAFMEFGKNIIDGLIRGIVSCIANLGNAIQSLVTGLINDFKAFLGIHSPSTVMAGIGTNVVLGLIKGITSSIASLVSNGVKMASKLITSVKNGIVNGAQTVAKAAKDLASGAIKAIKDKLSKPGNLVKDLLKGLSSGLAGGIGTVKEGAKKLAESVKSTLMKFWKIKSPSRVMMGLGQYLDEGLVLGIQNKTEAVTKSARTMASSVLGTVDSILNDESDGMSYSPTFTPVMDMSNLETVKGGTIDYAARALKAPSVTTGLLAGIQNGVAPQDNSTAISGLNVVVNIEANDNQSLGDLAAMTKAKVEEVITEEVRKIVWR